MRCTTKLSRRVTDDEERARDRSKSLAVVRAIEFTARVVRMRIERGESREAATGVTSVAASLVVRDIDARVRARARAHIVDEKLFRSRSLARHHGGNERERRRRRLETRRERDRSGGHQRGRVRGVRAHAERFLERIAGDCEQTLDFDSWVSRRYASRAHARASNRRNFGRLLDRFLSARFNDARNVRVY